jgi:hypothetical protein
MEVDNDPRLDMSLDDLIKQNKKEVVKVRETLSEATT